MLDVGSGKISVGIWLEATRVFAPFTGIGFAANTVHCDRKSFVSLGRESSHGHSCSRKAFHDFLCGLYFFKWNAGSGDLELEDVLNRDGIVSERDLHIVVIVFLFSIADEGVKILDNIGGDSVSFARFSIAIVAGVAEVEDLVFFGFCLEGSAMAHERFLSNLLKANSPNSRVDTGKGVVDYFFANSKGFEDLRSLIRVEDGDAHFGHDFQDSFFECLAVVRHCMFGSHFIAELLFRIGRYNLSNRCIAKIRTDRSGSESKEACNLVGVTCFSGIDNK